MTPSPWIDRFASLVAPAGNVLDLACGSGRQGRVFLKQGHNVVFVDRQCSGVSDLSDHPRAEICVMDLEDGRDWPFKTDTFDAIVVTNYLYRPHLADMVSSLRTGGVLLYETFARGNERFGRPSNPDFLLKPGELLELVQGRLQVVAFEQGQDGEKVVQRLCAVRSNEISEYPLT